MKNLSLLRIFLFTVSLVATANSEGVSVMDRHYLSGEQIKLVKAEVREGIPISELTATNALVAYNLGDEVQVVLGTAEIEVTTTPWGPVLETRGAAFHILIYKGSAILTVSKKDADKDTIMTVGTDASVKTTGEFVKYEYKLDAPPDMELPEALKTLMEGMDEFLASAPANARAKKD